MEGAPPGINRALGWGAAVMGMGAILCWKDVRTPVPCFIVPVVLSWHRGRALPGASAGSGPPAMCPRSCPLLSCPWRCTAAPAPGSDTGTLTWGAPSSGVGPVQVEQHQAGTGPGYRPGAENWPVPWHCPPTHPQQLALTVLLASAPRPLLQRRQLPHGRLLLRPRGQHECLLPAQGARPGLRRGVASVQGLGGGPRKLSWAQSEHRGAGR